MSDSSSQDYGYPFDRKGIYQRFAACYDAPESSVLAKCLGITPQATLQWANQVRPVPWARLRELVIQQNVSWDWLILGKGMPKRGGEYIQLGRDFDTEGINARFLSLYSAETQQKLGQLLNVSQVTVWKWIHAKVQVPWEKLYTAVQEFGVTWNWILENITTGLTDADMRIGRAGYWQKMPTYSRKMPAYSRKMPTYNRKEPSSLEESFIDNFGEVAGSLHTLLQTYINLQKDKIRRFSRVDETANLLRAAATPEPTRKIVIAGELAGDDNNNHSPRPEEDFFSPESLFHLLKTFAFNADGPQDKMEGLRETVDALDDSIQLLYLPIVANKWDLMEAIIKVLGITSEELRWAQEVFDDTQGYNFVEYEIRKYRFFIPMKNYDKAQQDALLNIFDRITRLLDIFVILCE